MKALLIVDPCPQTRLVLTPFLEEQGYELTFAADAEAALAALWDQPYAAILVDLTDPAAGGEELLKTLKDTGADANAAVLPFVGADDAAARRRLSSEGFPVTFPKPLDFHVMTNVLADLVDDTGA